MAHEGTDRPGTDHVVDAPAQPEEVLIIDPRATLTPAQLVERKLVAVLRSVPLPMSRLQTSGPSRRPRV